MIKVQINDHESQTYDLQSIQAALETIDIRAIGPQAYSIIYGPESHVIEIIEIDSSHKRVGYKINGKQANAVIQNELDILLLKLGYDTTPSTRMNELKAPMPGLVVDFLVKEGDEVSAGKPLMILEAMKMENLIKATGEGKIKKLEVEKGKTVEKNQLLITFE